MANIEEKLKRVSERIQRLKELKQKIEKRIKKERKLAYEYAKEIVFWYFSLMVEYKKKGAEDIAIKVIVEKLKEVLCRRAKDKIRCLHRKLEIVAEHSESDVAKKIAYEVLRLIEEEQSKGGA